MAEINREDTGAVIGTTGLASLKRMSWGAVWAGVMIALGMEILLTLFGLFIGFRMYNFQAANPWSGVSAWATVWYLITAAWSMFFGAWCASRLSGDPVTGDGSLHGITMWGLTTIASIAIVSLASWAVLREGINVLGTAAVTVQQMARTSLAPAEAAAAARAATQSARQLQANAGPVGQATADLISRISLGTFFGVLIGFVTAVIGGRLGQNRKVVVATPDIVTIPTRRAA